MKVAFFLLSFIATLLDGPLGWAQEAKLESLVVSYAGITGGRGPLWVAKDMRLFEKYGLDVKLVHITAGSTSINALLTGDVDMVITTSSATIAAAARGAPVAIIATSGAPAYKLVALPSITSVQQLKGKIIGSSLLGAGSDFALRKLLPKIGLMPGKDVSILPTGLSESIKRILLMFQGKIDATLATSDNVMQLELKGQKLSVLADLKENGVYVSGTDIATTRQFLKEHPEKVKAFLKAFSDGIWTGRNNRDIVDRVYRKYLKIDDPRLLESMYKTYFLSGQIPLKPYPQVQAIQSDLEYLSLSNPDLKGKKPEDLIDPTPLQELESEGFFAQLHR
jgi:NitT/TauT family transport system substrate-binding protein